MGAINFKEIPRANLTSGEQDSFELFARDFLDYTGMRVVEDPGRGPDSGKDMTAIETRSGLTGSTEIRWLVSCKHFAHSGASVGLDDELNIVERVEANRCNGFLGVYSTLPSSALADRLVELRGKFETSWFDGTKIERFLWANPKGVNLARRFFPNSVRAAGPKPATGVIAELQPLECDECSRDLLLEPPKKGSIYVFWRDRLWQDCEIVRDEVLDITFSCKGDCDRSNQARMRAALAPRRVIDGWDDIPDLFVPTVYISKVMALLNNLRSGTVYSDKAFDRFKHLLLATYPYVCGHPDASDEDTLQRLMGIPSYFGGMG